MRKLVLLAHISLDGFVAGPKGELDGFESAAENLGFVCQLTEEADAALFGRISYQLLDQYWPQAKDHPGATPEEVAFSNWYNKARKIVISRTLSNQESDNTTVICEDIPAEISKIKEEAGKDILIFGSPSVSQLLMRHELIDSYWIFINPVIFGKGIPLFAETASRTKLTLLHTHRFANGELALNYGLPW
ncbi:MAG TPA: dihydrofolate reductase family protein [Chitinophagaceae bacterium]|nr:dihydrofolate reductase family protein [Chitinophagaceae bacterium]